ncbi:hypothetical protein VTO73DRAFT_2820 [Trametes versicolor]
MIMVARAPRCRTQVSPSQRTKTTTGSSTSGRYYAARRAPAPALVFALAFVFVFVFVFVFAATVLTRLLSSRTCPRTRPHHSGPTLQQWLRHIQLSQGLSRIDVSIPAEHNIDNWLDATSPHYKAGMADSIFHYAARVEQNERFSVCIATPEMREAA